MKQILLINFFFKTVLLYFCMFLITSSYSYAENSCIKLRFNNNYKTEFNISTSDTPQTRQKGLMFKKYLPENEGMLFIWDKPRQRHMWMKNTYISLDMIFIKDDTIIGIIKNATPESLEILTVEHPANKLLEINGGLADKYNLKKGDKFTCFTPF